MVIGYLIIHATLFPSVAPDVINTFTRMYPRLPMTDYEEQTIGVNLIRDTKITALRRIICYNQSIYDDVRLEVSEYAGLGLVADDTLSTQLTEVEPMYDDSAILIIDDDSKLHIITTTLYISFWGRSPPKLMMKNAFSVCVLPHTSARLRMHEINSHLPYAILPCHACT